ncbi:Golgi-associated PDZ and coiled-coil motif-containing protein-like isoform X2 [Lycorma delicatula]|uniref:Golgi-associated PDZ and coiled-coil motif-containing protein-like isoform X2 n=1 Tax=Lycorma delicatula TaxID=130591 RepID=UPI003F517BAC
MAVTAVSFRWLDILEKEFDKAFVDLDLLIGDLDSDEPEMVYSARQKMATLSSCFAQLTHKAQTIFQNSAKIEAELVHMRTELVETKTRNQALGEELHAVLVQLHTTQLQQLPGDDGLSIQNKLQKGLIERSPTHKAVVSGNNIDNLVMSLENWKSQLEMENDSLRNTLVGLQAEVCGARLAARYLDKELAGRIQQLQLLGRSDMTGEARDRLWSQLEAEILVQRQKTVMRAVRQRDNRVPPPSAVGTIRTVQLTRHPHQGLGISITGGREHGVPILISELEPGGNTNQLYVGDAILSVNGIDLRQASHQEAVNLLSSQIGNVTLKVQYLASGGDDSEEDHDFNNLRYGFFEDTSDGVEFYRVTNGFPENRKDCLATPTPTAPRTPDSSVRDGSECSYPSSPSAHPQVVVNNNDTSTKIETTLPLPVPPHLSQKNENKLTNIVPSNQQQLQQQPTHLLSPRHFGVTTLQKIFRSFTPSGVWSDGTEEESKDANDDDDDDDVDVDVDVDDDDDDIKSMQSLNRIQLKVIDNNDNDDANDNNIKIINNDNIKINNTDFKHDTDDEENDKKVLLKIHQPAVNVNAEKDCNKRFETRWIEQRDSSQQLFHPETEAVSLVDGLGDASFGTPV